MKDKQSSRENLHLLRCARPFYSTLFPTYRVSTCKYSCCRSGGTVTPSYRRRPVRSILLILSTYHFDCNRCVWVSSVLRMLATPVHLLPNSHSTDSPPAASHPRPTFPPPYREWRFANPSPTCVFSSGWPTHCMREGLQIVSRTFSHM